VVDGSNYDVTGDFSIAMTFAAQDVTSEQGLLYKGTGSPNTSPALDMSYRLEVNGGAVALTVTESDGTIPDAFVGRRLTLRPTIKSSLSSTGHAGDRNERFQHGSVSAAVRFERDFECRHRRR